MTQTSLPSRSAVLLTLASACVVGVVGGSVAVLLTSSDEPGDEPVAIVDNQNGTEHGGPLEGVVDTATAADVAPERLSPVVVRARKGGSTERRAVTRFLDAPDPERRYAMALQLMEQGPEVLVTLRALDPQTDAGRNLVGSMIGALEHLSAVQSTKVWPTLWDDKRLELKLQAFEKAIPVDYLNAPSEEFYEAKAASDRKRLELGHIREGELYLTEVLLAGAKARQGKIERSELASLIESREPVINAWLLEVKESNRFAGRRWTQLRERFDALRRL